MSQNFNPFEHHHDHHHDDDAAQEPLDPAQQSVADALRVCFLILKLVMIAVVAYYIFGSGFFNVEANEQAIVYTFGKRVGDGEESIKKQGGPHFSWPYPIGQVERVPTSVQILEDFDSFWPKPRSTHGGQTSKELQVPGGPLNPELDGSLLTGDANIIHARYTVQYKIEDVEKYIENRPRSQKERSNKQKGIPPSVQRIVQIAAQQGMIYAAAQVKADDIISNSDSIREIARQRAQRAMDVFELGITITQIIVKHTTYPGEVKDSIASVTDAIQGKSTALDKAKKIRDEILIKVAGEGAYEPLIELITDYELATDAQDKEKIDILQGKLDEAFGSLKIKGKSGKMVKISGTTSEIIISAQAYADNIVSTTESRARNFEKQLAAYRKNPRLFRHQKQQKLFKMILGNPRVEKKFIQGKVRLLLKGLSDAERENAAARKKPPSP